jgi:phosphoribosylformylglycinamidine cyclo-ligase
MVVRMKRDDVINASQIQPGHVIVGLSSSGQSVYEDKYNSGISSNGLTAARHMLLGKKYLEKYPESLSETIPADKAYCGKFMLSDMLPDTNITVGEAILSPTRTYLPILIALLPQYRNRISGIIHCTGGGQVKCRDFGHGVRYVKDNLFEIPPIFKAIYESGEIPMKEMYQVFNCGHRMEIYCDPDIATEMIATVAKFGVDARIVGRVESSGNPDQNEVVIRSGNEEFKY